MQMQQVLNYDGPEACNQEDAFLLELVRYIHLNPLRAKLVKDYNELQTYPFCVHDVIMGKLDVEWPNTNFILRMFDTDLKAARSGFH